MKLKNTIDAVEPSFEERTKYYLDQFFQDEELIGNAINKEFLGKYSIDFFRKRVMSFIRDFHPLKGCVEDKGNIVTDMMRREGGEIVRCVCIGVYSQAERRALELAKKEFEEGMLDENP